MSTTLEFELGPADLDAFWVHHATYAPYIVARNRRMRWIWTALCAFLSLTLLARSPAGAAAMLVLAIVYLLFYDRVHRWWYVRHNRRINSGPDGPRFGVMRLELADGHLLLENAEGSSKHALSAIRRIDESDSHVFIYLGPVAALVVPKAADPARAFMQGLRAEWALLDRDIPGNALATAREARGEPEPARHGPPTPMGEPVDADPDP